MRKPPVRLWNGFIRYFERLSREAGKEQYIVPYLMSAFPGCGDQEMRELAEWLKRRGWRPEQAQCFLPTPGTLATAMFFAGVDADGRPIAVARSDADRLRQHRILMPEARPDPRIPAKPGEWRKPFAKGRRPPAKTGRRPPPGTGRRLGSTGNRRS
jgi:radical SAM superfamily enzyme YgiQ (UPF0313 family)